MLHHSTRNMLSYVQCHVCVCVCVPACVRVSVYMCMYERVHVLRQGQADDGTTAQGQTRKL